MKETITLNQKEQARLRVLNLVLAGVCTLPRAAQLLGVSERQARRMKQRYRRDGPSAIAHGNRGRRPANAIPDEVRALVEEAASTRYAGYNHSHLHEILVEEQGVVASRPTVARLLRAAGIQSPRRRRPRQHRSRRARMPQEGMLIQVDASHHDWLEGRGPRLVLLGGVDDATGAIVCARFGEREDAAGYLRMLRDSVRAHGIPLVWYTDKHGAFHRNDKEPWTIAEQLAGRREPTQVGRALEALGIKLQIAHSPQAKGRVERCWQTLQDRLVKELRRAGACSLDDANVVLAGYLPRYRMRFAQPAADPALAYRPLARDVDLDAICSFHYVRVVGNDNVVQLEERSLQLPPGSRGRSYAGRKVDVQERLDGRLVIFYRGRLLAGQEAAPELVVKPRRRRRGRELLRDPKPALRVPVEEPEVELPADLFQPRSTVHPWRRAPLITTRKTDCGTQPAARLPVSKKHRIMTKAR